VTLLVGEEADLVEAGALADYDVIHIASHARFSEGLPARATLRLAAGVPLTASAVQRLPLQADLIYLSCCEAAQPLAVSGLGSFARACLDAGAGAVIASGLRVDDAAAADLAVRFYRRWQEGLGKAAALREAQLGLLADHPEWSHPYYWATYRLIGDPR
jgi:CHAT domain-containing protein